jgi:hypothetical protein
MVKHEERGRFGDLGIKGRIIRKKWVVLVLTDWILLSDQTVVATY